MQIYEFIWNPDRIDHIARHSVTPEEVEEACFGAAFVQRVKSEGSNPVYYVLGQTEARRYLFCVIIQFPHGRGYPVTARPMTEKEKRRYRQWRGCIPIMQVQASALIPPPLLPEEKGSQNWAKSHSAAQSPSPRGEGFRVRAYSNLQNWDALNGGTDEY